MKDIFQKLRIITIAWSAILWWNACGAQSPSATVASTAPTVSHDLWDDLLRRHVQPDGWVNYKGIIADSAQLNHYLAILSAAQPTASNWSREEKMAFWINAYNAFTVKLIVEHYPVKSIKDIKRGIPFVNTVWDIKFIHIGGKTYDLNNIEHSILRPDFKDARIHAAINCASYSCPVLRAEAYVAEKLDSQLTDAMRRFINDPLRNRVSANEAQLSEIFKWFRGDFTQEAKSIRHYINKYAARAMRADANIKYIDYDWRLNDVGVK